MVRARPRKKSKYHVAVVGCGQVGVLYETEPKRPKPASHAGAVMANKKTELVALVDTNAKNLATAQRLFPGAAGYASLAECLKEERPDIAIIATPPSVRLAAIRECARSSVPMVICEKPLAESAAEAKRMQALVAKSGMMFVLNYQRRFSPLYARLRADIKKGKLGRIQQVTGYYSNGLYSNGGHAIDALLYLLGDEIISAIGSKNNANKTHPAGDINIDALLMTKKGTPIVLQSFDQKEYGIHDLRLYGTKGSAVLTDYGVTLVKTPARPSRFVGIKQLDTAREHSVHAPLSATKDVLAHSIKCYEKHRLPASSVKNGLLVVRILDAIAASARQGGKKVPV